MNNFDFFVGTWTTANRRLKDRYFVGGTEWVEFPGILHCHSALGGAANIDEIEFPTLGYSGMTVRLLNSDTDEWSLYWISTATKGRIEPPVVGRFDNGIGVFEGDDVHEGKPIRVRFTWSDITAASARWQQELSNDDGKTWELDWVMEHTRTG